MPIAISFVFFIFAKIFTKISKSRSKEKNKVYIENLNDKQNSLDTLKYRYQLISKEFEWRSRVNSVKFSQDEVDSIKKSINYYRKNELDLIKNYGDLIKKHKLALEAEKRRREEEEEVEARRRRRASSYSSGIGIGIGFGGGSRGGSSWGGGGGRFGGGGSSGGW